MPCVNFIYVDSPRAPSFFGIPRGDSAFSQNSRQPPRSPRLESQVALKSIRKHDSTKWEKCIVSPRFTDYSTSSRTPEKKCFLINLPAASRGRKSPRKPSFLHFPRSVYYMFALAFDPSKYMFIKFHGRPHAEPFGFHFITLILNLCTRGASTRHFSSDDSSRTPPGDFMYPLKTHLLHIFPPIY